MISTFLHESTAESFIANSEIKANTLVEGFMKKYYRIVKDVRGLNVLLLHLIVNIIGAPDGIDPKIWANIALAMILPVSILGNFFGCKVFVFKKT